MVLQAFSVQVNNIILSTFIGLPCSDSAYRQKVQKLNDKKYTIQNEIVSQIEVGTLDLFPLVTDHGTS